MLAPYSANIKLVEKEFIFEVIPSINRNFKRRKLYKYHIFSYGEVFIFENDQPKYYYNSFNEDGSLKKIAFYASQNSMQIEELLVSLLKDKGFLKVKLDDCKNTLFEFYNLTKKETLLLLEIIEF